jgi:hypothetical protein
MKSLDNPHDKQRLMARLAALHSGSPRQWGRMSAHQMICHLNDSFSSMMGDKAISSSSRLAQRTVIKWIALYTPLPWPKGVPTRPEVDQLIGGTPPVDFQRDMAQLFALVERFTRPERDFKWQPHPIFGEMSEGQWMRWGYLHMDHHLRQFGA